MEKSRKNKTRFTLLTAGIFALLVAIALIVLFATPIGAQFRLEQRANSFEGLSESDARKKASREGLVYREVYIDGQKQALNADLRPNRINVAVSNGKVIEAHFDEGERFSQLK